MNRLATSVHKIELNPVGARKWQEGYGAFSVGISQETATIAYINSQEEYHRTRNYEDEFVAFLRRHRIEYDSRYVLG